MMPPLKFVKTAIVLIHQASYAPPFLVGKGAGGIGPMKKSKRNIVIGQRVIPEKVSRARRLRKQMTEAEKRLWERLRGNRIDGIHFRRQQIIDGFIVDFYCHAAGVVIEIDGEIHAHQATYDAQRDAVLKARGLQIIRISNEKIHADIEGVVQMIRAHVKSRI